MQLLILDISSRQTALGHSRSRVSGGALKYTAQLVASVKCEQACIAYFSLYKVLPTIQFT